MFKMMRAREREGKTSAKKKVTGASVTEEKRGFVLFPPFAVQHSKPVSEPIARQSCLASPVLAVLAV
jgi:hypothetical protein